MSPTPSPTYTPSPYYVELDIDPTARPTILFSGALHSATEVPPELIDAETTAIESNASFYTTLIGRLRTPGDVVDATELFPELAE